MQTLGHVPIVKFLVEGSERNVFTRAKRASGEEQRSDDLNLSPNRQITRPKKVEPVIPILNLRDERRKTA